MKVAEHKFVRETEAAATVVSSPSLVTAFIFGGSMPVFNRAELRVGGETATVAAGVRRH